VFYVYVCLNRHNRKNPQFKIPVFRVAIGNPFKDQLVTHFSLKPNTSEMPAGAVIMIRLWVTGAKSTKELGLNTLVVSGI